MDLSSTLKQMSDELAPVLLGEKAPSERVADVVSRGHQGRYIQHSFEFFLIFALVVHAFPGWKTTTDQLFERRPTHPTPVVQRISYCILTLCSVQIFSKDFFGPIFFALCPK